MCRWDKAIQPCNSWDESQSYGPVGLIIKAVIWHGMKIDKRFNIWQDNEEPIDISKTPYQFLQALVVQTAARARTKAAWQYKHDPKLRFLRGIDKQAFTIDKKLTKEEKGILRTHVSGGAIAKKQIAGYNKDVTDPCDYCRAATSTANHTTWCVLFSKNSEKKRIRSLQTFP